ncbi:hypothetical protein GQX74_002150 [Glossina fuscipes]|nr:hypothetical protein GQX74_002150 [Glossina fuscipes]
MRLVSNAFKNEGWDALQRYLHMLVIIAVLLLQFEGTGFTSLLIPEMRDNHNLMEDKLANSWLIYHIHIAHIPIFGLHTGNIKFDNPSIKFKYERDSAQHKPSSCMARHVRSGSRSMEWIESRN